MPPEDVQDRAAGVLVGVACGDAIGRPVEFVSQTAVSEQFGTIDGPVDGGRPPRPAGTVTDDTELTLRTARSLVDCHRLDPEDVSARFVDWLGSSPLDVGYLTRDVLEKIAAGKDWSLASYEASMQAPDGRDAGNGSLMRCTPIAVAFRADPQSLVSGSRVISAITHYDTRCQWSCALFNYIVAQLIRGDKPELTPFLQEYKHRLPSELQDGVSNWRATEPTYDSGYVISTLHAALYHGLTAESPREGICESVNHGGDADTIGALTGALLGARFGATAFPTAWVDTVSNTDAAITLSQRLLALDFPAFSAEPYAID
ncbi:ADP-ribosylglycohydrolase [Halogeometricum borinquense DSM 11551]|uniref:ADP-ribosylglycohydrolase n=2 Tax=Halogeometricum borinquense TaxID=60847 RepID=E4NWK6_HALBP|nr:ADP-ribosylglycohydrolase family protein [Halogeometricum borinquense]ADQ69426.1 ADP-ribosylglycohydrolase [Halogeometricum borinquense DSM 11551]ELY25978.1 ADP-ribosylglycohydrolase [Halogeometricum borinquense DSM 11551]RYJ19468.1 ADP-ribosylglycohydrolase family protein [Halogeometricum borinquense]